MNSRKEELKQHIEKYYDYISARGIAEINKEYGYGCTVRECADIEKELYGDDNA